MFVCASSIAVCASAVQPSGARLGAGGDDRYAVAVQTGLVQNGAQFALRVPHRFDRLRPRHLDVQLNARAADADVHAHIAKVLRLQIDAHDTQNAAGRLLEIQRLWRERRGRHRRLWSLQTVDRDERAHGVVDLHGDGSVGRREMGFGADDCRDGF